MGSKSNQVSKACEGAIEQSLKTYLAHGFAYGFKAHPQASMKARPGGYTLVFGNEGPPDWTIVLTLLEGRACHIESKTWAYKDKHTLQKRIHQYHELIRIAEAGGLAYYLVKWRHVKFGEDWRLYPIHSLVTLNGKPQFIRHNGYAIPTMGGGLPHFLEGIVEHVHGAWHVGYKMKQTMASALGPMD